VEGRAAAEYFLDARRGSDEIDPANIDVLGSQPVPLQPPSVLHSSMLPAITGGRSLWPVIAILGCVIAVLVAVLIVLAGRPPRRAIAVEPAAGAAAASAADQVRIERVRRPSEPYQAAIRGHERALHRCATERAESFPVDAEAVIAVGVDGRVRHVTLRPDSAESSDLGVCIRRVLQDVTFPPAPDEKEVAVGLAVYR
jgi:hypothetical protein